MVDDFDNWVMKFVAYYTALQIVTEWLKATEPKKTQKPQKEAQAQT